MSRLTGHELVKFGVVGPDSKDVPWQDKGRIDSKAYSPSDYAVLQPYHLVTTERTISLRNGTGFVFDKLVNTPSQQSIRKDPQSLLPHQWPKQKFLPALSSR